MRRSSKDKNKTSPGPSGPGEVASGLVRILPKPVSQSSRHRIVSAVAADPCPKHPAGRRFPPPGGFRREPPVPDFAASHLAGSGFMMVWARRSRKCSLRVSEIPGPFPQCGGLLPRGGYLPLAGSLKRSGKSFRFPALKQPGRQGDSIRRICSLLAHRSQPPSCAFTRCHVLVIPGKPAGSARPFSSAATPTIHQRNRSCPLHSGGPVCCPFPPSYWGDSTRRVWDTAFVTGLPPARD